MTIEQRIELGQELNRNDTKLDVYDKDGNERYLIKSNSQMNFIRKTFDPDDITVIAFVTENGFNTIHVYAAKRYDASITPNLADVLAKSEEKLNNALDEVERILNDGGSIKTRNIDDPEEY